MDDIVSLSVTDAQRIETTKYATIPFCGEREFTLVFDPTDTYGETVLKLN